MKLAQWQELERQGRRDGWRGLDAKGLPHPDTCPKIVIQGVAFAIPSRAIQIVPARGEDGIVAQIEGEDKWGAADEIIRDAPIKETKHCETCGQAIEAVLEIVEGAVKQMQWLGRVMSLVWDLLDVYYQLDDGQKKALLSFPQGGVPDWLGQILDWCRGGLSSEMIDG